jgi:hypothetical protein
LVAVLPAAVKPVLDNAEELPVCAAAWVIALALATLLPTASAVVDWLAALLLELLVEMSNPVTRF